MNLGADEPGCRPLLFDANVLIDYNAGDRELLALITQHSAPVKVLTPILDEVQGWTEAECIRLGLTLVEPTLEQLLAANDRAPALSFQDQLCFILCHENEWICVTNDARLRRACQDNRITTFRGLRPIIQLVRHGHLQPRRAMTAVQAMHEANSYHLSAAIVQAFLREIGIDMGTRE